MATQYDTLARLSKRRRTICISPQSFVSENPRAAAAIDPSVAPAPCLAGAGQRTAVRTTRHGEPQVWPRAAGLHAEADDLPRLRGGGRPVAEGGRRVE